MPIWRDNGPITLQRGHGGVISCENRRGECARYGEAAGAVDGRFCITTVAGKSEDAGVGVRPLRRYDYWLSKRNISNR